MSVCCDRHAAERDAERHMLEMNEFTVGFLMGQGRTVAVRSLRRLLWAYRSLRDATSEP